MNDNPETPVAPLAPTPVAAADEPAAPKPARRRRTVPTAEDASASDDLPAPVEAVSETAADAEVVKPRRRRAAASKPIDDVSGAADPADQDAPAPPTGAGVPVPGAAAPDAVMSVSAPQPTSAPAEPTLTSAAPAEALAVASVATPSGVSAADREATPAAAGESHESPRSRRRGRRERRRDEGVPAGEGVTAAAASAGFDDDDERDAERDLEGADDASSPAVPAAPPPKAEEVFAQVLSGAFDIEEAAELATAAPLPPKRVLPPDADAPKLHKVLAQAGVGSRRDMEELILDGQITVNGQPAHIGQRISFGDQIKVQGKPVKVRITPPPPRIIAYHKPVGEVVTHDDPQHRPTVFRRLPRLQQGKWQSVGRLDINTEGLLLFTNSGELANQLMHPRFGVEREYAVRVLGTLSPDDRDELLEGVDIEGQKACFRSIEDGGGEGANHWYRVVINEGRNREVRKLFDTQDLTVSRLIRIRYGTVVLPRGLKRGVWVDLEHADVQAIRHLTLGDGSRRDAAPGGRGPDRGGAQKQRNDRQGGRPNDRSRGPNAGRGRPNELAPGPAHAAGAREGGSERDPDADFDFDPALIPNPLEQTFDKRFVQNPRSPAGGRGFGRGGGGFGAGGSAPAPAPKQGPGPKQPDPLQTSMGYLGADAYHRKGGGGGGGRGGNRGGGGGGGGYSGGGGGGAGNRGGGGGGSYGGGGTGGGGGRRGR